MGSIEKHTTGPWSLHTNDPLVITAGGETIAGVDPRRRMVVPGQAEADARLIAAAPDMLEALRANDDLLSSMAADPRLSTDLALDSILDRLNTTLAAIAKATGEA